MSSFSCGQAPICKLTVGWPILTKLLTPITLSDWGGSLPLHPLCPGKFRFSSIQQLDFAPSGGKLTHGYPWMRSKESFMTVHSRAFSHTATLDFPGFFSSPFPFLGSFSLFFPFFLNVPFVFVVSHPFPFFFCPFVSFFQDGQDPQPGLNHWKLSFARQISFGTFVFRCLSLWNVIKLAIFHHCWWVGLRQKKSRTIPGYKSKREQLKTVFRQLWVRRNYLIFWGLFISRGQAVRSRK